MDDIKNRVLSILNEHTYGLTIEDISNMLKINRATASKYLCVLNAEKCIVVRAVGKAKLHYVKDKFGG
jgi:response regulator of citrate/malate metabolism